MRRVDALLARVPRGSIDILLLPEMAFAGYRFDSPDEIEPYLEQRSGPTCEWAKATALRLDCVVCVGFAERTMPEHRFNSQLTVSSTGARGSFSLPDN